MGEHHHDFARTIAYGEAALGHLKHNEIPAYPRHYELWYTYAAGFNPALNRSVNAILRERGRVSLDEMQHIYNAVLSPHRLGGRIEQVGGRVASEIDDLERLIQGALDAAGRYGVSLREATDDLQASKDDTDVRAVVARLIASTLQIEAQNRALEVQLSESKAELESLHASLEAIRHESLTDQLTTLGNRKHFDQSMEHAVVETEAEGQPLSLILTDIDHFKRFNDGFGHQTGDQVLRLVAQMVKQNIKGQDIACRFGGEEFAVILPRTTLDQAAVVAEHIRLAVAGKDLVKRSTGELLGRVTVSAGVAAWRRGDTVDSLIRRADSCLYRAKDNGRNRVEVEDPLPPVARIVA